MAVLGCVRSESVKKQQTVEQNSRYASIPAYMPRSGSKWRSLVQVLPLAWPQHWYLSTEIPSTQMLKACPYTGPCYQRSAESTISLEKTATLESSANMFMHAVFAVNSAAGVKYLGSNSLEFNATYVDKRFRFLSAFQHLQHLLTFINDLFGSCDFVWVSIILLRKCFCNCFKSLFHLLTEIMLNFVAFAFETIWLFPSKINTGTLKSITTCSTYSLHWCNLHVTVFFSYFCWHQLASNTFHFFLFIYFFMLAIWTNTELQDPNSIS